MKKKLIIVGVIIIIAVAAISYINANKSKPLEVQGYEVGLNTYQETISGIGYVDYEKEIIISAEVGGKIKAIKKEVADRVDFNEDLLVIDDSDAKIKYNDLVAAAQLSEARLTDYKSGYNNSKSTVLKQREIYDKEKDSILLSLAQLEVDLERTSLLVSEGISPQIELTNLENQKILLTQSLETINTRQEAINLPDYSDKALATSVEDAKKNILTQEEELDKYNVRSELEGIVLETYVKVGELIQPGQDLMKIASDNKKYAVIDIDEQYIELLQLGKEANLISEQNPTKKILGKIAKTAPIINRETGTIEIKVEILEEKEKFLQNMSVRVDMSIITFDDAVVIPGDYLVENDGLKIYTVDENNIVVEKSIDVYNRNLPNVYVTKGLVKGDILINPKDVGLGSNVAVILKGDE